MNTRRSAFTLLELLVVIAIISILMGILMVVIPGSINSARRSQAATTTRAVAMALRGYATDYGHYPKVAEPKGPEENRYIAVGDVAEGGCSESNAGLFHVLRARPEGINAGHALNPRQQRYFEAERATSSKPPRSGFADGTLFPPELEGCYIDPWGGQYCIVMDADGDGETNMADFFSDLASPRDVVRMMPAVFSLGKDGKRGGTDYRGMLQKPKTNEATDDIVSWR
jgi:prepilin-type N-terminal cleavage/methylation domain-containing protein